MKIDDVQHSRDGFDAAMALFRRVASRLGEASVNLQQGKICFGRAIPLPRPMSQPPSR